MRGPPVHGARHVGRGRGAACLACRTPGTPTELRQLLPARSPAAHPPMLQQTCPLQHHTINNPPTDPLHHQQSIHPPAFPPARKLRFLANVDPVDVAKALNGLNPGEHSKCHVYCKLCVAVWVWLRRQTG